MKILRILYHVLRRADRYWALCQVDPLDDDVPTLVLHWHWHNDRLKELLT